MKNLILLIIDDLFPIALNILKHSDLCPFSQLTYTLFHHYKCINFRKYSL